MKTSALIVSIVASVTWLLPINLPIGILFSIGGLILAQEAFQVKRKLCMILSIFGLVMALIMFVTMGVPLYYLYGLN